MSRINLNITIKIRIMSRINLNSTIKIPKMCIKKLSNKVYFFIMLPSSHIYSLCESGNSMDRVADGAVDLNYIYLRVFYRNVLITKRFFSWIYFCAGFYFLMMFIDLVCPKSGFKHPPDI